MPIFGNACRAGGRNSPVLWLVDCSGSGAARTGPPGVPKGLHPGRQIRCQPDDSNKRCDRYDGEEHGRTDNRRGKGQLELLPNGAIDQAGVLSLGVLEADRDGLGRPLVAFRWIRGAWEAPTSGRSVAMEASVKPLLSSSYHGFYLPGFAGLC